MSLDDIKRQIAADALNGRSGPYEVSLFVEMRGPAGNGIIRPMQFVQTKKIEVEPNEIRIIGVEVSLDSRVIQVVVEARYKSGAVLGRNQSLICCSDEDVLRPSYVIHLDDPNQMEQVAAARELEESVPWATSEEIPSDLAAIDEEFSKVQAPGDKCVIPVSGPMFERLVEDGRISESGELLDLSPRDR